MNDLWGAFAFHAVSMFVGVVCLGLSAPAKQVAKVQPIPS